MEDLDVDSIFKLKVDELKQELAKRNLPKSGSKADLVERLLQHVTSKLYTTPTTTQEDESTVLEDSAISNEVDTKLEASLEAELDEEVEEEEVEEEKGDGGGMDDDLDNSVSQEDEFTSTVSEGNTTEEEEFQILDQTTTDNAVHASDADTTKAAEASTTAKQPVSTVPVNSEKPKFCRVTITSPVVSEKTKKESRSKRFADSLGGDGGGDEEKKKARRGRFSSMGMGSGDAVTDDDVEKIKKRAERFGAVSSVLSPSVGSADKLSIRKERFADPIAKKRQERFGTTNTSSLNLSTDMEARKQSRLAKFGAL